LNLLDLKPGEAFCICKDWDGEHGKPATYRIWLPAATEQERAAEEAEIQAAAFHGLLPAPDLPEVLEAEYQSINRLKRRKSAKRDDQPRLFDRGTGTYGPAPQPALPQLSPAQARAAGAIPYNVAFREITQFVTAALDELKEQWTDQAKQDAICTILISAQKQGLLKVWER
jgi:hypothetical protein